MISTTGNIIFVVVGLTYTAVLWWALFGRKENK